MRPRKRPRATALKRRAGPLSARAGRKRSGLRRGGRRSSRFPLHLRAPAGRAARSSPVARCDQQYSRCASQSKAKASGYASAALRRRLRRLKAQARLPNCGETRFRALTKPTTAKIALIYKKSEAIFASCVSCTCILGLRAFSTLWQSVDFVNILKRVSQFRETRLSLWSFRTAPGRRALLPAWLAPRAGAPEG